MFFHGSRVGCDAIEIENITTMSPIDQRALYEKQHAYLQKETSEIGLMLGSKFFFQLITTPIVGYMIARYGYSKFMLCGFVIMFVSTLIFAFGGTYVLFFIARSLQGFGASCLSVAGLSLLAHIYQDHRERQNAIGISLGGLAIGNLVGPVFGGVMFELVGKTEPFLILSAVAIGCIVLQLLVRKPSSKKMDILPTSLGSLLVDPHIILTSVTLMVGNMGTSLLEAALPIWMVDTMNSARWQQGAIFTPFSICYLSSTYIFGTLDIGVRRWITTTIAVSTIAISFLIIPLTTNIIALIIPMSTLGFATGLVDSSMLPELAYLVDIRHSGGYASAYVIGDLALCIGDTIAPTLGGIMVNNIGFQWTLYTLATSCFLFIPCIYFRRQPNKENMSLLSPSKRKRTIEITKNTTILSDL